MRDGKPVPYERNEGGGMRDGRPVPYEVGRWEEKNESFLCEGRKV